MSAATESNEGAVQVSRLLTLRRLVRRGVNRVRFGWWVWRLAAAVNPQEAVKAGRKLGRLGDPRAVEPLVSLLGYTSYPQVVRAACDALSKLGSHGGVEALIGLLRRVGYEGAVDDLSRALAAVGPRGVAALKTTLSDWHPQARAGACRALAEVAGAKAVRPILPLLGDKHAEVRRAVAAALASIGTSSLRPLIGQLESPRPPVRVAAIEGLGALGDVEAVDALVARLDDQEPSVRAAACRALTQLGEERAVAPLIDRVEDRFAIVQQTACEALGRVGDERAVRPLVRALADNDYTVREAACVALGRLGDPRALGPLTDRIEDTHLDVRRAACAALATVGPAAVETLLKNLDDADPEKNEAVIRALEASWEIMQVYWQSLLCQPCLTRFEEKSLRIDALRTVRYAVCRTCGKAVDALEDVTSVVAVFAHDADRLTVTEGEVKVNWYARRELFGFEALEIVDATDYDIERFCIEVGNDPDEYRRQRYEDVYCEVHPDCGISRLAVRLLQDRFGAVHRQGAEES